MPCSRTAADLNQHLPGVPEVETIYTRSPTRNPQMDFNAASFQHAATRAISRAGGTKRNPADEPPLLSALLPCRFLGLEPATALPRSETHDPHRENFTHLNRFLPLHLICICVEGDSPVPSEKATRGGLPEAQLRPPSKTSRRHPLPPLLLLYFFISSFVS